MEFTGVPVVYVSEHQSTAALETLVHLPAGVYERYKAFRLEWRDDLTETFAAWKLTAGWRASAYSVETMRICV